jgi:hypothetical protein
MDVDEAIAVHCSNCGAVLGEGAKFCAACGHQVGAPIRSSTPTVLDDDAPVAGNGLPRNWLITAIASAVVLVVLVMLFLARRDPPGPNNANARKSCDAMVAVSKQIVNGQAPNFQGLLDEPLKFARAAAKDDTQYATLSAAMQRLNEDPTLKTEKGGKAVQTIAEECK